MNLKNKKGLIIFVRHGQTDWNLIKRLQGRENVPLNEVGHSQAETLAELILDAYKMITDGKSLAEIRRAADLTVAAKLNNVI